MDPASTDSRPRARGPASAARQGQRRARLAGWASFAAAAAGAAWLWQAPWFDLPGMSKGILAAHAVTAGLVWLAGARALLGQQPAHASLRWWAPAAWAFVHFAWPGVAGLAVAYVAGARDLGVASHVACALAALCLVVAAVASVSHAGVALTMQPPWPRHAGLADGFKGLRGIPAWAAVLATVALNLLALQGSARLLERTVGPRLAAVPAQPSATRAPIDPQPWKKTP